MQKNKTKTKLRSCSELTVKELKAVRPGASRSRFEKEYILYTAIMYYIFIYSNIHKVNSAILLLRRR